MKSILFFGAFLLCVSAFSQADYDKRLLSKFSEERVFELQKTQPQIIDYWTYYLDHSYQIIDGKATGKTFLTDESLKIKNMDSFNVLDLGITMDRSAAKIYKINGTDKYLRLLSNDEFVRSFNSHNK